MSNYNVLNQGESYRLEVIKEASARNFFKVRTPDGQEFKLRKFKFQEKQAIPDYLDCFVKSLYPLSIGQDITVLIRQFYKEGYEYEFKVKEIKTDPETHYDLEDDHGLQFKLFNVPILLSKGNIIKCKILRINGVNVSLQFDRTVSKIYPLEYYSIDKWLALLGLNKLAKYIKDVLNTYPEFNEAAHKYNEGDASWILDILQACSEHFTNWLIANKDNIKLVKKISYGLDLARLLALYILEESDYLRSCNPDQRKSLQERLSKYVNQFEQYQTATSLIISNKHVEFIDRIFRRLKEAGFLYMPSSQISIMMTILKLKPELINERMNELFETLHNWDLSNWQSDPFRAALVEQLQIFIEENYGRVNILPANDSSADNKPVSRMIVALAIQRLLALEKDNIDLDLNRAIFYRYISYLLPDKVVDLLDKGVQTMLGAEAPNEYSWQDTETPTLLFNRSSHPFTNLEREDLVTKTYSTSKADIHLSPDSIHIVAKDSDPENTVIPNTMFEWMNPVISLNDNINVRFNRNTRTLDTYKKFWGDVVWSIMGVEEQELQEEKVLPSASEDGDEVSVVIDNVRILSYGHEAQRLQFHCTIRDDVFRGEGWMPCDPIHMISWLRYKDIPNNYDGTLGFAQSDNGSPLLFHAKAKRKGNGEIEFNMKSQIENHLIDTTSQGDEFVAIVTHRDTANNAWLCLTEQGSTFKIPIDNVSEEISEGKIVRVKYLQPDWGNTLTLFFRGELSEDQSNLPTVFKKSVCLTNLMQSLGEEIEEEENCEVVETKQVMSHDELMELIFILRRRAFSETEYIKAYNYLGLVLVLCKIADDISLARDVEMHMQLIEWLQYFGMNNDLDVTMIENFEDNEDLTPMLERLFTRIKIVADMESNNNMNDLWQLHENPRNETEALLTSLVLSYKMLPHDMESSRKQIMNQITTLLNVNNMASTSKYYGEESQTVEFKSSMVYTPGKGARPAPKEQMFELTHIICGFMNARGGKLYIGVNDSGYENGLNDDLAYRKSRGEKVTLDAMKIELQNHLDRTLPPHAKDNWEISSDPDSKKGVIIVDVRPVMKPVELDGVIYVRSGSSTKPRLGEEREEFIKNRSHNYQLIMKKWGIDIPEDNETSIEEYDAPTTPNDHASQPDNELNGSNDVNESYADIIQTGKHRLNVLHDWEVGFATPALYVYFKTGNRIFITTEDNNNDYDEDCRLGLAIRDKEMAGDIIMTFADNRIVRISIKELEDLHLNQYHTLRSDSIVKIANIAGEEDYILSVLKSSSNTLQYRIDKVSDIVKAQTLNSDGQTLCDIPHSIIWQEIIEPKKLSFFSPDALGKDERSLGISFSSEDLNLSEDQRIDNLLYCIAPTD